MKTYRGMEVGIHTFLIPAMDEVENSSRFMWPKCELDLSPPSSAEDKNGWSYNSISLYFFMAWCLIKHRDKFTPYNTKTYSNSMYAILTAYFFTLRYAATHEFPNNLWNPKTRYCSHKSPPMVPILSQINPVPTTTSHLRIILISSTP
jgi:hypothetical protein